MRVPASTYRFQVTESFDLHEVARRLEYLHDLGIDWVYLSPLLQAEPGSDHGYDVVDPTRIDTSRGGPEGLAAVSAEARRLGMGVLVDVVPNHVGVATPAVNPWWWDLLTHGPSSAYAPVFDVDWDYGQGKVRVPVLGDDDLPTRRDGSATSAWSLFRRGARVTSCATTTTASRSRPGPSRTATPPRSSTAASTTSWWAGAAATPS